MPKMAHLILKMGNTAGHHFFDVLAKHAKPDFDALWQSFADFLCAFCADNPRNQALLAPHREVCVSHTAGSCES